MKKALIKKIEIPGDVDANIEGSTLTLKGPEGENKRTFGSGNLIFEKNGNEIIIQSKKGIKKEKKNMNTIIAHIKNMIKGVETGFEYKLKIVSSHFPITVEMKNDGALIKNFLGEKKPRKIKIKNGVEIKIDKEYIIIKSVDKELAGQSAADFEVATKIKKRDRRVFQDGIFIISKDKREM